jgi:Protein of unknown function (DUF3429)
MVRRIAWLFSLTGLVIFAGLTAVLVTGDSHIRVPAIAAMVTFAAIVISYLGGIEGGLALREEGVDSRTRAIALAMSGLPSLAAWGVLLRLPTVQHQIGADIAIFIVVWAADLYYARHGLIPSWFVDLRTAVTAIACAILGVALYLV